MCVGRADLRAPFLELKRRRCASEQRELNLCDQDEQRNHDESAALVTRAMFETADSHAVGGRPHAATENYARPKDRSLERFRSASATGAAGTGGKAAAKALPNREGSFSPVP
jgi:hypothetical protein